MKEGEANNACEQIFLRKIYLAKLLSFEVSPHLKDQDVCKK